MVRLELRFLRIVRALCAAACLCPHFACSARISGLAGPLNDGTSLIQYEPAAATSGGHIYHLHIPRTAGTSFQLDAAKVLLSNFSLFNPLDLKSKEGCYGWRDTIGGILWVATMLRNPRAHVLSQYLLCSEGHISLVTGVPKGHGGFGAWVERWSELLDSGKVVGDFSAADRLDQKSSQQYLLFSAMPMKCYCPLNLQSHHLTCKVPYTYPAKIDGELAIQNMNKIRFVGIQEAYHESMCLFYVKVRKKLPEYCNCTDPVKWKTFWGTYASYHGDKTRTDHNVSHQPKEVLRQVDKLTAADRALYKAGVERFVRELHEVEQQFNTKIMCDSTLAAYTKSKDPMQHHFSLYLREAHEKLGLTL